MENEESSGDERMCMIGKGGTAFTGSHSVYVERRGSYEPSHLENRIRIARRCGLFRVQKLKGSTSIKKAFRGLWGIKSGGKAIYCNFGPIYTRLPDHYRKFELEKFRSLFDNSQMRRVLLED